MCSAISLLPSTLPSATQNSPYSTSLSIITQGGNPPYSYSAAVLPTGLMMDSTGAITGTPTAVTNGPFTGSVTVTDSCSPPQVVPLALYLQVLPQPLTITTSALPLGIQGAPYRQTIQVSGGVAPYSFGFHGSTLAGTGLALDTTTGTVSGSPTVTGQISFKVLVSDSQSSKAGQTITIQIDPQLVISTLPSLHYALSGQPYSVQFATQPGTGGPNVTWSAPPNALPGGLTLEPTGLLHGTPSVAGNFSFSVQATDGISPAALNATLASYGPLAITTPPFANGTYQQAYGPASLTATGGSGSFVWSATGLPTGVAVSGNAVQGTPTVAGQFKPVTLTLNDTVTGQSTSNSTYSLTIAYPTLVISSAAELGGIAAGGSLSTNLNASGGLGPYKWAPVSLPSGFSISSTGGLTGTAASGGNLSLTVQVTDSEPQPVTVSKTFTLNVLGISAPSLPTASTASAYAQTFGETGGSPPYTFSATGLPAGLTMSNSGAISGTAQQAGTFPFVVHLTDGGGIATSGSFSVTIIQALAIATAPALPFGIVNQAYSQALTIQSGTGGATVIWSTSSALPTGLTLDKTGLLHGTPGAAGSFSFTISANDGISPAAVLNATMTVYGPISISIPPLPSAVFQQSFGPVTLTANGGSGNFNWSATGLPGGVTISTAGIISGTPTTGGTFSATVSITDNVSAQTASQPLSLSISYTNLSMTPVNPIGAAVGGSVSTNLAATGGLSPYKWQAVGSLPPGFALTDTGALTGTPLQPGNLTIPVQVTDSEPQPVTIQATVTVNVLGFTTGNPLPPGLTTATYSQALAASGGTPPYSFSGSGLPSGLSLTSSGTLSGAMKKSGTYSFSAQVSDSAGIAATTSYSVTISGPGPLSLTSPSLANGTVNALYSGTLSAAATGGNPPYQWSVQAGTIPAGMTLSATGILSGTPTVSGAYSFTVQATDGSGANASAPFTLQIDAAPLTITTQSPLPSGIVGIVYPQQILTASGGISPYTFSETPGQPQPDGLAQSGLNLSNGVISGTPSGSGSFSVGITVTDNAGTKAQTTLSFNIRQPAADIVLSTGTLSFALPAGSAALPSSQSISVGSSDGSQPLGFSTQVSPGANWLMVSGQSTTPASLTVGLTTQASSLAGSATPYSATITVTCVSTQAAQCSASDMPQTVTVSLVVTASPGVLNVQTDLLSFSITSSPPAASAQPLDIQNAGGQSLGITSISCEATWCHVGAYAGSLDAGVSAAIPITADPTGLPPNYYRTAVDIVSSGGVASIPVTLLIAQSSQIVLGSSGAQIEMPQGGTLGNPNGSFLVTPSGSATLNWTASVLSGPTWLTLNTPGGTASGSAPGTVSFSINQAAASTLPAQAWYGTIEVDAPGAVNSPQDFQVVFDVTPAASPSAPDPEPAGLVFITEAGATPPPQTVQVFVSSSNSTAAAGFTASTSTNDGGTWLSVNSLSGTTSPSAAAQTQVSIDPTSVAPGVYYGGVNYAFASNPAAIRTVNVTLIVQPPVAGPAGTARQTGLAHPNASAPSGCSPKSLAPAPTGLVDNFSAPASWPTPVSIFLYDDCGNAVSSGQVVVSFTNGDPPLALGLANSSTGLYSGTWTPRNAGSQVALNARATAAGFPAAAIQLTGAVVPNVAPVLNKGGTLHVFNPQVGAAMAPGTIVQIYGSGLASGIAAANSIPLPTSLNGTSVIIGGVQAPLYFVSPGQINAQIPFQLNPSNQYQVIANANGALTTPLTIQLAPETPGFAAFADGGLIAQHAADGTLITQSSPAQPGEYVVAYLAGMGGTTVPVQTGGPSPSTPLAYASVPPTLTLNGVSVPVSFAGMTPGLVGLYQLDFQIPSDAANGTITVVLSQGAFSSNATTLPVTH